MTVENYVVVNPATKRLLGGPYRWDGEAEWTPPEIEANPGAGYQLLPEADAQTQGYAWPPPPTESWVIVDQATTQIVNGPFDWNGQDDPPPVRVESDTQQYLREGDALGQGYTYP